MSKQDLFGASQPAAATTKTRRCLRCERTPGEYVSTAFTGASGTHYPEQRHACLGCNGIPDVPEPDYRALVLACRGRKGGLRSSRPTDKAAYYVWRMARFHGGADVTMPIGATSDMRGHPWLLELDELADLVAKRAFGTKMAAAHRWGMAMGHIQRPVPGLPDSAYPCGRVADQFKPLEEMAELI